MLHVAFHISVEQNLVSFLPSLSSSSHFLHLQSGKWGGVVEAAGMDKATINEEMKKSDLIFKVFPAPFLCFYLVE